MVPTATSHLTLPSLGSHAVNKTLLSDFLQMTNILWSLSPLTSSTGHWKGSCRNLDQLLTINKNLTVLFLMRNYKFKSEDISIVNSQAAWRRQ